MANFIAIKLKALFMLTVFAANFYSVCHCRHLAISNSNLPVAFDGIKGHEKDQDCDHDHCSDKTCADNHKPCNEKDGCCGTHAIKFSQQEKQAAEQITLQPLFVAAFTRHFIMPLDILLLSCNREGGIEQEWLHKHSPPDLQSLYQRYLI
ncbi:MAG TPA: hypothetical protein VL727_19665 [Puia sp.]|nr:hypothetical protein [Puia sp.]